MQGCLDVGHAVLLVDYKAPGWEASGGCEGTTGLRAGRDE